MLRFPDYLTVLVTIGMREERRHTLLPIMKVVAHTRSYKALSCLWDGGADISLITNSKARQLNLKGKPIKLYVTTAGGINQLLIQWRMF